MTTNNNRKAPFFFARNGNLIKLKARKHPLVFALLQQREKEIILWYRKHIADEFSTAFPHYVLSAKDFERVKEELQNSDDQIVIFLQDMFHPILRLQSESSIHHVQDK